jgi:hypothetical protein
LNSLFSVFVCDLLTALGDEPASPAKESRLFLQRWRELFDRHSTGLSREAAVGLFGELWHLDKIQSIRSECFSCWKGPRGGQHDFQGGTAALEVKTTTSKTESRFRIHGIYQLEPPSGCRLFLAVLRLIPNPAGMSLHDLIHRIRLRGGDLRTFEDSLSSLGYSELQDDEYRKQRYEIVENRILQVEGSFPRVVRDYFKPEFPSDRISYIEYEIDLSGFPAAPLGSAETRSLYRELGSV